ncbi:ccr4-associated factor, putative, partial [Ricinus communis]
VSWFEAEFFFANGCLDSVISLSVSVEKKMSVVIHDVWEYNLGDEIEKISQIDVGKSPYVGLQTWYPTVFKQPIIRNKQDKYNEIKENVEVMKLIQLGLCFCDEEGNLASLGRDNNHAVWQFNFREFDRIYDLQDSVTMNLMTLRDIDFAKNREMGIDAKKFGELVVSSGVVRNDDVKWVTFDGGYNYGHFLKLLTGKELPEEQAEFFNLMKDYFPVAYDVKHMIKLCDGLNVHTNWLSSVAELMGVKRPVGMVKQSGSDSVLSCRIFKILKQNYFNGPDAENINGSLCDLGVET